MALPKVGVEAVIEGMAKFEADSKKVNKSLDNMGTSTRNLGSIASGVTSKITSLAGSLLKIGAVGAGVAIAGIGAGLYTAASAGLSFNNTMEQARAKINAFTKDAELTDKILEDVRLEAAKTPFEFDAMANAVSGLLPAAKQADVGIMDLLKDAEVLAASNPAEGLEGAAFALREAVSGDFTSVIERFNLPRQMINQLKAEGLPALEIVRTAMKDMGYDMDLVSALANTAEGRWSTFKDTLTNLSGIVTQPLFDALSGGLGSINDWLTLISPQLEAFANMLAGQVAGAIEAVVISVNKVVGAFQRFGVRGAAVSILGQLGLEPEQIAQVMSVVDQVAGAIDKITGAFQRFGLKGATVSIMGQLGLDPETIGLVFTTIDNLTTKISTLQTAFAQFGAMGAGVSLLSMLGLSSENISLITTSIQAVVDGFNALADWWLVTWPTIQAAALTGWEILKGIFVGFQTALGPILTQLNTQFTQVFSQLGAILASFGIDWQDVWTALLTATGIVATGIGAAILGVIGVVAGLATGIAQAISAAITMFQNLATNVSSIITGLTGIVVGFNEFLSGILSLNLAQILEGAKILLQGFGTFFGGIWSGMITVATGSLNIITGLISGFVTGIIGFFQGMYNQLVGGSIVPDMINAIVNWFKRLPQMVTSALSNLVSMVVEPFEDALAAIEEMWKPEKWFELGTSVIEGILEGIKKSQDQVLEMLKSLAKDALQAAKDAIGFGSPAKEFMTIGESMVQGMLLGAKKANFTKKFIDDLNMGGIARELGTGGGQWRNFRNIIKNQIGADFDQLMTSGMSAAEIIKKIQDVAARFNFPPSMASEFAMANGLIEHLTSSVTEFQQAMRLENMGRMAQIGGQFASFGSGFADILGEQIESNQGKIELFRDFLTGKIEGTSIQGPFGMMEDMLEFEQDGLKVALNRSAVQNSYNRLLAEQLHQQELIAQQQKSQEQLGFLQQQIKLIEMGKELGTNVFEGITFGLNANVEDLLAATNNVVTAMVNQINSDLQIASPSKVMARIGQQIMAGLQGGIASMTPVLNAQLSASVAGPLSPSMAGAMNSSSYSTTNNFNVGGNNINNGMQAAEFEARVLQVIRRNL